MVVKCRAGERESTGPRRLNKTVRRFLCSRKSCSPTSVQRRAKQRRGRDDKGDKRWERIKRKQEYNFVPVPSSRSIEQRGEIFFLLLLTTTILQPKCFAIVETVIQPIFRAIFFVEREEVLVKIVYRRNTPYRERITEYISDYLNDK